MHAFITFNEAPFQAHKDSAYEAIAASQCLDDLQKQIKRAGEMDQEPVLTYQPSTGYIYCEGQICGILYKTGYPR